MIEFSIILPVEAIDYKLLRLKRYFWENLLPVRAQTPHTVLSLISFCGPPYNLIIKVRLRLCL